MDEALALCQRLVAEGISTVVATPHQLGRFDGRNDATKVRDVTSLLNAQLQRVGIRLTVLPGADVRVDERICRLLEEDRILTIADDRKYILLELPHQIFIDVEPLLAELEALNVKAIISHPERHNALLQQPKVILRWLKIGAYFQIDAGSLLGDSDPEVCKAAWLFLSSGWASFVATDAHDTNVRRPRMRAAFKSIRTRLGEDIADLVCIENPARIVEGKDIDI
jgi:protein-tyrosine phosphatase